MVGGIQLGGSHIRSVYASPVPASSTPLVPLESEITLLSPGRFLAAKRLYFDGSSFTAEQVLLFIANKAGGVHLDSTRNPQQAELELAAGYMTFGNPNNESLARIIEHSEPGGPCTLIIPAERGNLWSALEIELLAATQSLVNVHCDGERLLQLAK